MQQKVEEVSYFLTLLPSRLSNAGVLKWNKETTIITFLISGRKFERRQDWAVKRKKDEEWGGGWCIKIH